MEDLALKNYQVDEVWCCMRVLLDRSSSERVKASFYFKEEPAVEELRNPGKIGIILLLDWNLEDDLVEFACTTCLVDRIIARTNPWACIVEGIHRI